MTVEELLELFCLFVFGHFSAVLAKFLQQQFLKRVYLITHGDIISVFTLFADESYFYTMF